MTRTLLGCTVMTLAAAITSCGPSNACPSSCSVCLAPGANAESRVQAAFANATAGSTLCFDDGTFSFTMGLTVSRANITVRGRGNGAVLDFAGQRIDADAINVTAPGFTIENLTVKNPVMAGNGIKVSQTRDVTFRRLRVLWDRGPSTMNGAYAVYPIQCTNVLIENCEIDGAADAGIYVGQSENIIVRNNVVHRSVAGIEIENSSNAEVYGNETYDNTAGILVFNLPNLMVNGGQNTNLHDNLIYNNNRANFGVPGTVVAGLPAGIGILVMAADATEMHHNIVRDNITTGAFLLAYTTFDSSTQLPMNYNPIPAGGWIHDNTFMNNGTAPTRSDLASLVSEPPLEDILWDGVVDMSPPTGITAQHCIMNNTGERFRNMDFEHAFVGTNTNLDPHRCMKTNQSPVTLPFAMTSVSRDAGVGPM